jgi:hypothetical protein
MSEERDHVMVSGENYGDRVHPRLREQRVSDASAHPDRQEAWLTRDCDRPVMFPTV